MTALTKWIWWGFTGTHERVDGKKAAAFFVYLPHLGWGPIALQYKPYLRLHVGYPS